MPELNTGEFINSRLGMDDRFQLMLAISGAIYDEFCNRMSYRFNGEEFELEDSEEGEPLVLRRKSDGALFEVELEAEVTKR
jgi:hypothetical protein